MTLSPVSPSAAFRALLLEDSRFDAELVTAALQSHYPAAQLEWVRDEDAFVAKLQAERFDIILSDYELRGFSGSQALDHALAITPRTPVVFVSGVIGEDNAVELLKRGATDYVSKGRLGRLPLVIDRILREAAQRQAYEQAQGQLQEAGITFDRVIESLRDHAVILLDRQGLIRTWNQAAQQVTGWTAEQMLGQAITTLFTPEDCVAEVPELEMSVALSQGKASDDRWMQRADGSRFWAEGSMTRLESAQGHHTGFCKIMRDGTASYEQGQALRQAKEEAEQANRAKDRFLAVLSHELRTPLMPIGSAAHILQSVIEVPEKYKNLLPMIQRNVALEARLIDDLLDVTVITQGKLVLKKSLVDINRLVPAVVEMLTDQAQDKGVVLSTELGDGDLHVWADEARMQQVLWNVVRNAIKFTPQGSDVVVKTAVNDGLVQVMCVDSGIGIESEALSRIFQAFEQADEDISRRFGGLGLGLAIAHGLVSEHSGSISAYSAGRGQGSTFTVSLPKSSSAEGQASVEQGLHPLRTHIHPQSHAQQHTAEPRKRGVGQKPKPYRILLVEDNPDAANALSMSLQVHGYEVAMASSCAQALQQARAGRFDLVLTDLGLPDGSGIDVGRALRGTVPVIALSGYGSKQDLKRSDEAGFAAHLIKPVAVEAVHAVMQRVLAEARRAA